MIHSWTLYENFNSEYGTNQNGWFRPVSDFVPALHEISLDLFNRLCGLQPRSQKIQDWLNPFRKTVNIVVQKKPAYDYIPLPDQPKFPKYEYYASSRMITEKTKTKEDPKQFFCQEGCDLMPDVNECILGTELAGDFLPSDDTEYVEIPVRLTSEGKWSSLLKHPNLKPTMKNPAMRPNEEGFLVMPRGIGVVVLDYFRKPVQPIIRYTTISTPPDEYLQFVETGSVHLEWSETLVPVFLYHLGKRYGLTVRDELILQVRQLDKIFE